MKNLIVKAFYVVVFLTIFLLCSCGNKDKNKKVSVINDIIKLDGKDEYTQDFAVYQMNNGHQNITYYYDAKQKLEVPLCNKPDCTHTNEKDCLAREDMQMPLIIDKRLYFYGKSTDKEKVMGTSLFCCKTDGSDRKEIAVFEDTEEILAGYYEDGKYYSYYRKSYEIVEKKDPKGNTYKTISEEQNNPYDTGLYCTDIASGKTKKVYSKNDEYYVELQSFKVWKNSLYFLLSYYDIDVFNELQVEDWAARVEHSELKLIKVDLDSLEETVVKDLKGKTDTHIYGDALYYSNRTDDYMPASEVYCFNLETGEEKMLFAEKYKVFDECNGKILISSSDGEIGLYNRENDNIEKTVKLENGTFISAYFEDTVFLTGFLEDENGNQDYYSYSVSNEDFWTGKSSLEKRFKVVDQ
ncbi:MAG: hypothetical protein J6M24_03955 [Lachnospiraceae bacterium]|nr:hypothetical protein [Lachnospiraceae bacterium]